MDVIGAFESTLSSAKSAADDARFPPAGTDMMHLLSMLERMKADGEMSYGKQCRWLGWAQGVMAARGYLTLEQCKQINKLFADPSPPT